MTQKCIKHTFPAGALPSNNFGQVVHIYLPV